MRLQRRWLAVLLPIVVVGVIEVASDSILDPHLLFPRDTVLVMSVVTVLAIVYGRFVFREIDRLAGTLRQRNAELEARHAEAAALHHVSVAMTALLDIDEILRAVVDNARTLLGADVAVLVLEGAEGEPRLAASSGPSGAVDPAAGQPGRDFRRFVEPAYQVANLAAPLRRGDRTIGTLAVAARTGRAYGVDDVETLSSLANQASIALENDRLQRELRELAVRGERERIAREMHDGLAQVLGYVNTKSQAVTELLTAGRMEAARSQLSELTVAAQSVYVDVREAILGLTSPIPPDRGLVGALEEYAARFSEASKLVTRVEAQESVRGLVLAPDVQAHVFRIVQEALTNVRKHASARRVVVSLAVEGGSLVIQVEDDGHGISPAAPPTDWPRYGLKTIQERAAMIGAELRIQASEPSGTRVELRIPMLNTTGRRVA
ncbi:MAG TPA: GAF domain-containing protein [Candidatus Acidoferrales bacterium]|nr:GAF domain-containing protein [Candidatus Acidoferrales bacterium]